MPDSLLNSPSAFFPYEIEHETRADVLADQYYSDPAMDWLVYLSNGIVDPYHGWYLSEDQFQTHLEKKYGSVEDAERRVARYEFDWETEIAPVSVGYYENNLTEALLKYYEPVYGANKNVSSYRRRRVDWRVETNVISTVTVSSLSGAPVTGELVDSLAIDETVVGYSEVVSVSGTTVVVKNVVGTLDETVTLLGKTSGFTSAVSSVTETYRAIPLEEAAYWKPVTMAEVERRKNERNKLVVLLDSDRAPEAVREFKRKIAE